MNLSSIACSEAVVFVMKVREWTQFIKRRSKNYRKKNGDKQQKIK